MMMSGLLTQGNAEQRENGDQESPTEGGIFETIQTIYIGKPTCITRAICNNKTYIVKSSIKATTNHKKIKKIFQEFMIGSLINSPYVVKYVDIRRFGVGFGLIMEDIGGVALNKILPTSGMHLKDFFPIAINTAQGLAAVHAAGVIHRDINPHNVVINVQTGALNIIDFGISSRLVKHEAASVAPKYLTGTLMYMAPEQTGRMNRHVDYRADFYSLGATFYELLTGRAPFGLSVDPIELIYKHMAVIPKPLHEVRPGLPDLEGTTTNGVGKAVSKVVARLMEKNAEDRYQDCNELVLNLREIHSGLISGKTMEDFVFAQTQQSLRFQISQKLYGRSEQVQSLIQNYNKISLGTLDVMLMLVHGYSGVGKTTLINVVHKPLVRDKGYYVSGKYNQFSGDTPYAAFIQALRHLIQQILSESEDRLALWSEKITQSVGLNGQIIIDVLPDLEIIIGKQPPVQKLGTLESQFRFRSVFMSFLASLASKNHPLVIFLDDLQWADQSSLVLLAAIMDENREEKDLDHILLLGAYRDNEVSAEHPFVQTVANITKNGGYVEDINLLPLTRTDVSDLVRDTLSGTLEISTTNSPDVQALNTNSPEFSSGISEKHFNVLVNLLYKKTQGNPFFLTQLFTTLHTEGHLRLASRKTEDSDGKLTNEDTPSSSSKYWECDIKQINLMNYSDNVVDLMVTKIRKMVPSVQRLLSIAATIGPSFHIYLLPPLLGLPRREVSYDLKAALLESFVMPTDSAAELALDDDMISDLTEAMGDVTERTDKLTRRFSVEHLFRFTHDRVQQAAASLLDESDVRQIHFKVAQELLRQYEGVPKEIDNNIFVIVHHLNEGLSMFENELPLGEADTSEKYVPLTLVACARLNLLAAIKAKESSAYDHALGYANAGIRQIEKQANTCWDTHYNVVFGLYKAKAELEYLLKNFEVADAMYAGMLERAKTIFDKTDVYVIMLGQYEVQTRLPDALAAANKALTLFNVALPNADLELILKNELEQLEGLLSKESVESWKQIAVATDQAHLCIMKLLTAIYGTCYLLSKMSLCGIIGAQMVSRSIRSGMCEESAMGFVAMSFFSGQVTGNFSASHEFGFFGVYLAEKFPNSKILNGRAFLLYGAGVRPYLLPLFSCSPFLEMAHNSSKLGGDYAWGSYDVLYLVSFALYQGSLLSEVLDVQKRYAPFWKLAGLHMWAKTASDYYEQVALDLIGDQPGPDFVPINDFIDTFYYSARVMSSLWLQTYDKWLVYADTAYRLVTTAMVSIYTIPETKAQVALLYLNWLARSPLVHELFNKKIQAVNTSRSEPSQKADIESEIHLPRDQQIELLKKRVKIVNQCTAEMQQLARSCPDNFEHKYLLIKAERARINIILGSLDLFDKEGDHLKMLDRQVAKQDFEEALECYTLAIESAQRYKFTQYEALGLELYGRFWITAVSRKNERQAVGYLTEALVMYEKWGAMGKAKMIQSEIAVLSHTEVSANSADTQSIPPERRSSKKKTVIIPALELETVIQACQTITAEVDVNTLILKMVKVIAENGNAQKATFFVLEDRLPHAYRSDLPESEVFSPPPEVRKDEYVSLMVTAEYGTESSDADGAKVSLLHPRLQLSQWTNGPISVVNFVSRTCKPAILSCAYTDTQFGNDTYISENQVKSVLCVPILLQSKLQGVMYLENNLSEDLYTKNRADILSVLTSQMAISLGNARFYHSQMEKQLEKIRFEQLQRDEERQRLRADAAEKYKVQLENFVDMICHEIRNPLNGIFGNADLMFHYLEAIDETLTAIKTHTQLTEQESMSSYVEQLKVCASSVQTCAEHQKCMADDVLQLSRLRANKLTLTNGYFYPSELMDTVVSMFSAQSTDKGIYLQVNNPPEPYNQSRVWGDSVRFSQIVTNLLSNAVKFTHTGGITVTMVIADFSQDSSTVSYGDLGNDDDIPCYLRVSVTDTGIGMTKEELSRIFKRFSQANNRTSKEYGGSGLGLAICRKLAKLMKGTILVESEKGTGTTFTATVMCKRERATIGTVDLDADTLGPLVGSPPGPSTKKRSQSRRSSLSPVESSPRQSDAGTKQHVLVVEDNAMNQLLLTRVLQLRGCEVHVANNGQEGFDKFKEQQPPFSAVLMDMQMPVMDGLESTSLIRKFEKETGRKPVVIIGLSGNAREQYRQQALAVGMDAFLTKPYEKEALFAFVEGTNVIQSPPALTL